MTQGSSPLSQPPDVDATETVKRKRLEGELFGLEGQLRTFDRIRDRLLVAGQDAPAFYRQLLARRAELVAALKSPRSESMPTHPVGPPTPLARLGTPLLSQPIAPAEFDSALGGFGIGSSGFVQLGLLSENVNVLAHGKYPSSGQIETVPGGTPGEVLFSGRPVVGPDEVSVYQYDPTINYFWLRTWKYLIPFPPPSGLSRLTYRFDVAATMSLFSQAEGQVMAFVSLGETPQLLTGTDVTVNIDGGWPLIADLSQPAQFYNGHYGYIVGNVTVQRSFMVSNGRVPGVAVVLGAVVALSMQSDLSLSFGAPGFSSLSILAENWVGRVAYSYEPQPVNEP